MGLRIRGVVSDIMVPVLVVTVGSASEKALKNKPSLGVAGDSLRATSDGISTVQLGAARLAHYRATGSSAHVHTIYFIDPDNSTFVMEEVDYIHRL
jgi:hypothetical protein